MNGLLTARQMGRRRDSILRALPHRNAQPTDEVIRELVELTTALEDEPVRSTVIARLTLTRANDEKVIVEIYDNATFHNFYQHFKQMGKRRSTKTHTRTSSRNDAPGLHSLAQKIALWQKPNNPIVETRIKIYRKKIYRRLLFACPEELGLGQSLAVPWRRFELAAGRS